jgi:rare lipoprotein A (peptidoglycan hydrolase)
VNLAVTVALVPALFTATEHQAKGPVAVAAGATLQTLPVVATAEPGSNAVVVLGPTQVAADAATTTTTTTPPTTLARRVVTTAPKPAVRKTTATTVRPRSTATAPPTTASTARSQSGKASWYDHDPGICAHKTLPFGTVVTVTDVDNGRSVQCTVGDRGPYVQGWIIDLNPREFNQLAPQSVGVLNVRITW